MKGTVEVREIHSLALEGNPLGDSARRKTPVYLPPGYANAAERFPAVYFLHGFTGSGASWTNFSAFSPTVPERIDALIAAGTIPPMIAIFVDGWTAIGGSQWVNSDAIGRYKDYVAKDVVAFADKNLKTVAQASGRAIVGKSSGGYGALVMAANHPDVFGHVACHSGDAYFEYCYLPDFPKAAAALSKAGGVDAFWKELMQRARETKIRGDDHAVINVLAMAAAYSPKKGEPMNVELPFEAQTAKIRPDVWARWLGKDPVRFVPKHLDAFRKLQSVFVDCGTRDEFNLRWGARMVVEELRSGGIDVVHEEFEDSHMGINYRYDRSLSYILPRMR